MSNIKDKSEEKEYRIRKLITLIKYRQM